MKAIAHLSCPQILQSLVTNFEDALDNGYGIDVNNVVEGVGPIRNSPTDEVCDDCNEDKYLPSCQHYLREQWISLDIVLLNDHDTHGRYHKP